MYLQSRGFPVHLKSVQIEAGCPWLGMPKETSSDFGLSKPSRTGRRNFNKRGTKVKPMTKSTDLSFAGNIVAFHMKPATVEVLHCISWRNIRSQSWIFGGSEHWRHSGIIYLFVFRFCWLDNGIVQYPFANEIKLCSKRSNHFKIIVNCHAWVASVKLYIITWSKQV